jgi:hypothetical protein
MRCDPLTTWKLFFALLQGYTRSYLAPPGPNSMSQFGVFMIRAGLFTLSVCSKCVTAPAGWRGRWLDLRVFQRQGKPLTSGYRLPREKKARSGAECSQGIRW